MRRIIFILFLSLFILSAGLTQNTINDIVIPPSTSMFMIGEVHLDNVQQAKTAEETAYINKILATEHIYRKNLVDSFQVNHFVMESAVSLEYFFNKYVQTGNEMWIDLFNNNEYQQGKLRSIAELNKQSKNIRVSCIDYNLKKYYVNAIQSLFCITFYEPFAKQFEAAAKLNNEMVIYDNPELAQKLLDTSAYFQNELKPFFQLIIDWYKTHPEEVANELFNIFKVMQQNDNTQHLLEKYYGDLYPYFARLSIAYVEGYNGNTDLMKGLYEREQSMFWQLQALDLLYPYDRFCLQMGAAHVLPNTDFDVIRQKIEKELKQQPFCFYIIPEHKIDFFSTYFINLKTANTNLFPWQQFSVNEAGVIVK